MISFREWLEEDEYTSPFAHPNHPGHDLWKHSVPALRHMKTGKIIAGKRGEAHWEIANKIHHNTDHVFDHHDIGYYHTKNKTFHDRAKSEETHDMDSTDLMTKMQRDRYMQRAHA